MWFFLSLLHCVWSITVQYPAVICLHRVVPESLLAVFHWQYLNESLHLVCLWLHWRVTELNLNVNAKSELQVTCDNTFPHTHLEVSGYHHRNHETDQLKSFLKLLVLRQSDFLRRLHLQDFSDLISHEMPTFSLAKLILGTFLLRYWNPFEFVLAIAFAKQLINPSFMWRGQRNIFRGLTRGMWWTLSVPGS
jgi:hypothetical protein